MVVPIAPISGDSKLGVILPSDTLAGLANDGAVRIACLFIVAAGLRETGVMNWLVARVFGKPDSLRAAQHRLLWPTAIMSAFLNNTPLVAMLLPVTQDWAKRHSISI